MPLESIDQLLTELSKAFSWCLFLQGLAQRINMVTAGYTGDFQYLKGTKLTERKRQRLLCSLVPLNLSSAPKGKAHIS